LSRKQG